MTPKKLFGLVLFFLGILVANQLSSVSIIIGFLLIAMGSVIILFSKDYEN